MRRQPGQGVLPTRRHPGLPLRPGTDGRSTPLAHTQYFNSTCVCGERFGGFDCGECSYAYNDGTRECLQKTVLPRRSVGDMSDQEWNYYLAAVKLNPARYVVSTAPFTPDLQKLLDSTVRPTTYNLFIWMHYSAAKDNAATIGRT